MASEAKIGDNSRDLTPDEEKALFFYHVRKDMATKARIKEIQDQLKADRKLAQADDIALSRIDFAEAALSAEDKSKIKDKVDGQLKIMEWLNIIPPRGFDLFADRAPRDEKIEGQGEIAGLAAGPGVLRVSPYAKDSPDDMSWLAGWDRGQAIMRDELEKAMSKKRMAKSKEEPPATGEDPFASATTTH